MKRKQKNGGNSSLERGFTLLELISVVAIIGILMVIIVVALQGMRDSAMSTQSASNLRQWGTALHLYMSSNRGAVPFEGDADRMTWNRIGNAANEKAWFNVLPEYVNMRPMRDLDTAGRESLLDQSGIHRCPFVEWRDARQPNFSYMMNSQIYHPGGPSDDPNVPVRSSHIQEPSITVMFSDLDQSFNTRPRGRGRHVDARHRNGEAHLMFFDGRVARYDAEYLRLDNYTANGINYTDNNKPNIIWNPWNHPRLQPQ